MPFTLPQGGDVKRRVAASLRLETLARRVDLRVVHDIVVVSAALLIGALLWLALAQPLPARQNRPVEPKKCSFIEREGRPCAPMLPSH